MKYFKIFAGIILVTTLKLSAQNIKPNGGSQLIELKLNPNFIPDADINSQYGGIMFRKFQSKTEVNRIAFDFAFVVGKSSELSNIAYNFGKEYHYEGSDKLSPYWGYSFGIGIQTKNVKITNSIFTGFDYYITDGLYIGSEIGFNPTLNLNPIEISSKGAKMNASLKFGYQLKYEVEKVVLSPSKLENPTDNATQIIKSDSSSKYKNETSNISTDNFIFEVSGMKFELYPSNLPGEMSWEQAIESTKSLGDGWSVPEVGVFKEMLAQINTSPNSKPLELGKYWTSTRIDDNTGWSYVIKSKNKSTDNYSFISKKLLVRPVRLIN